MPFDLNDYLLDQTAVDWQKALATWGWLLPDEFTLWLATRFADLFLVFDDGTVHMLDVGAGTLNKLADSRDDFCTQMDDPDTASFRLMIPIVDQLVVAGVTLQPGQCYGFRTPPGLGGGYELDNIGPLAAWDYLAAHGEMWNQFTDLPDGSRVRINVVD